MSFAIIFLVLVLLAGGRWIGAGEGASRFIFRIDPLAAVVAMLTSGAVLWVMWPALITVGLTALLGRFFCGWVCPLGTTLDVSQHFVSRLRLTQLLHQRLRAPLRKWRSARFVVLILTLLSAVSGLSVVGWVDPMALLLRGWTTLENAGGQIFARVNGHDNWRAIEIGGAVVLAMLVVIILAEVLAPRFWCRYLCPLGALLGLVGRYSPLVRVPKVLCRKCPSAQDCADICRMDAFGNDGQLQTDACTLCMDCLDHCPHRMVRWRWLRPKPAGVDLSRRTALTTIAVGAAVPLVARVTKVMTGSQPQYLLRPPGVSQDDDEFSDKCIRCGLCIQACPTGALQPALWQAGLGGVFSPILTPRVGYCQIDCIRCGEVCPTGAIPLGQLPRQAIIGKAMIDRDRCLPWATGEPCDICYEACRAVADREAIVFRTARVRQADGQTISVQRPYVRYHQCLGCGACETQCPLMGESAIRVLRQDYAQHQGPGSGQGDGGGRGSGPSQGAGRGMGQGRQFR